MFTDMKFKLVEDNDSELIKRHRLDLGGDHVPDLVTDDLQIQTKSNNTII